MSPLPEHSSQPIKPSASQLPEESTAAAVNPDLDLGQETLTEDAAHPSTEDSASESSPAAPLPTLHRPVMRPTAAKPPSPPANSRKPAIVSHHPAVRPEAPVEPAAPALTPETVVTATMPAPTGEATQEDDLISRQQPIPPPSEPKQYRAIGLLRGRYTPSEDKFTRGELTTTDGTAIEAVLLGRIMSLVKNHLDLEHEHLWVVYPRTREKESNQLHAQIVGVWEPETLSKSHPSDESTDDSTASQEAPANVREPMFSPGVEDDYFSVRGEIVYHSAENQDVIVKIQQSSRKEPEKAKAFKLKLEGVLPSNKALGYFWDLQVKRSGNVLVITDATNIGLVPPRKKDKSEMKGSRKPTRRPMGSRPSPAKGKFAGGGVQRREGPISLPKRNVERPN
jgi:hypothetical protein